MRVGDSLDDRQFGALRQRSTTRTRSRWLTCYITDTPPLTTASRYARRTVFVDFAKAFDHVDHNVLSAKMVSLGLPDVIVRWICAFLRER